MNISVKYLFVKLNYFLKFFPQGVTYRKIDTIKFDEYFHNRWCTSSKICFHGIEASYFYFLQPFPAVATLSISKDKGQASSVGSSGLSMAEGHTFGAEGSSSDLDLGTFPFTKEGIL